jgi:hypothetical protein
MNMKESMKQSHLITAFEDPEDRQSARVLLILILSASLAFLFVGVGGIVWHKWIFTLAAGLGIVLQCMPVLLLRGGRLHTSSLVLTGPGFNRSQTNSRGPRRQGLGK